MPVPLTLAMQAQFVRQASSMVATLVVVQADTLAPNVTLTSTNVTKVSAFNDKAYIILAVLNKYLLQLDHLEKAILESNCIY